MKTRAISFGLSFLGFVAVLGTLREARACGGFFCGGSQPVVQAAERVMFEKTADGNVRTWVQIQYQGPPIGFSWLVPVSAVPTTIGVANVQTFNQLDRSTTPQFVFNNGSTFGGRGGFGCGGSSSSGATSVSTGGSTDVRMVGDVTVWEQGRVGNYDTAVLSSTDATAIFDWLATNSYTIPDAARPIVEQYVREGQKFVAFRYDPTGFTSGALDPVVIEYPGNMPCVPIRITAIASTPVLDVMILAFAEERAWPAPGYVVTAPNYDQVRPDYTQLSLTTYEDDVLTRVTDVGGRALVTEYANTTAALQASLTAGRGAQAINDIEAQRLLSSYRFVTRFYTRLTPGAMTMDPMFVFLPGATVSNVHNVDLTSASRGLGRRSVAEAAMPLLVLVGIGLGARLRRRRR